MKHVLIPTDFSNNSLNACEYALQFFKNQTCHFYFLHVVNHASPQTTETFWNTSTNVAEKVNLKPTIEKLQNVVRKIRIANNNEKHHLFSLVEHDYFVDAVRKQISEKHIDYIVMGTRGASEMKNMFVGSNTADIITKVKCTTLVIPENSKFKPPKEIVFPSDFSSSYTVQNLEPLQEILGRFNSSMNALYVKSDKNELLTQQQESNRDYFSDCFPDTELHFHYLTNKYFGDAIDYFTRNRETGMIAMLAKNLNYFHQILFKPTIEEVTYQTNLPFLILHE